MLFPAKIHHSVQIVTHKKNAETAIYKVFQRTIKRF